MSTRLTKDIRDAIAKAVMKHRYENTVKSLINDKAAFGLKVYEDLYSKSTREKISALPDGWLSNCESVGTQFGAEYSRVYFDGYTHGSIVSVVSSSDRRKDTVRLLAKHVHGCAKVYEATHALSIAHDELSSRERALKTEFDATRRQVDASLNAATTVKRLIEMWPEIAPFASKYEGEKPQLPALPTEQLNKILGLPASPERSHGLTPVAVRAGE